MLILDSLKMNAKKQNFLILIVVCVCTILPFLGATEYNTKGEPRESIVSYSMLETGNWVLPRNYGGDMAFKPPFLHWSIAAVSSLSGGVTEYASRLPSALALIAMMLGIYAFYAKRKDAQRGLLAAFITMTCFEVHRAGFACRVDMVLTAFIVLAMLQFYFWYERKLKGIPWLAILFMGCATLTKGPVGIILPCMVIGVFLWIKEGHFWKLFFKIAGIALLACIIPAIWYGLAFYQGGDDFVDLMMEENFGRFLGKMSYESHENPIHYNFVMLIAGYVPWSLLLLFSLFCLHYRKPSGSWKEGWNRMLTTVRTADPVHLFSFLGIVLIFIFYCIPASKRSVYLLPIYPFIGYFLAVYFQYLVRQGKGALKAFGIFMSVVTVLLTVIFFIVRSGLIPDTVFSGKHFEDNIALLHALEEVPLNFINWILILLPLPAVVFVVREMRWKPMRSGIIYALCGLCFAVFVVLDGVYQPAILGAKSDKPLAQYVKQLVPEGKIYSYGPYFYGINYYNNNRMAFFNKELPEQGYLLVGQRKCKELEQNYGSDYVFEEVYKSPRRSCDIRDIVYVFRFTKKAAVLP